MSRIQKDSSVEELYDRIWKTKSARFNAYHRLSKTHVLSSYSTSLLSVYVIVLSLLQPFCIIENTNTIKYINFASACVSIMLLVFVLMEGSMQYNLKAEKFHDCAKSLGRLFKKIELVKENPDMDETDKYKKINKIAKKYDNIIDLYDNHKPIDFEYHRAINGLKGYSKFKVWFIKFRYRYLVYFYYYIAIYLVPFLLLIILFFLN